MFSLYDKAKSVVKDAPSGASLPFSSISEIYFKRVNFEAMALPFPKITRRFKTAWWKRQVANMAMLLTLQEQEEALQLMVEKNKIYGNKQIYVMGTLGILIRSIDKLERIKNIDAGATSTLLKDEGRRDSVIDLFNYAILAVLCINKEL